MFDIKSLYSHDINKKVFENWRYFHENIYLVKELLSWKYIWMVSKKFLKIETIVVKYIEGFLKSFVLPWKYMYMKKFLKIWRYFHGNIYLVKDFLCGENI